MPELPEVEVVRSDLDPLVRERVITRVEVGRDRAIRREADADAFRAALAGRAVTGLGRVGKFLVAHLDGPEAVVVHLGMSGQLLFAADAAAARPPHTHVVWTLDGGREVRFVDPRTFGQMFRARADAGGGRPDALAHLGPDARDDLRDVEPLARALAGRQIAVKLRLMDQTAVAGLGNIYTDEILYRAGVAPARASGTVTDDEVAAIAAATAVVLSDAIAARGSSLADAQYVDGFGRPGRYQEQHAVHARAGLPCPRCGRTVARLKMGGRFASWCPGCQS
jgi:formamidopyrimidine-DNA glycosylase